MSFFNHSLYVDVGRADVLYIYQIKPKRTPPSLNIINVQTVKKKKIIGIPQQSSKRQNYYKFTKYIFTEK